MSIELTLLGIIVIPVTALILLTSPRLLLPWTFLLAPFQAASVLNIYLGGSPIGIQPGYFAAISFVVGLALQLLLKARVKVPRGLVLILVPLLLFVVYAALGAALLPRVFEGAVEIFPPEKGISLENLAPLQPSGASISQVAYMLFLTVFAIAVSLDFTNFGGNRNVGYYLKPYLLAGCLVVFFGLYQLGATYFGIPYPYDLLYSNPGYESLYGQTIGGDVKRLSSTFTEPSVTSYYLVGVFALSLWYYLFTPRSRWIYPFCVISGFALLLTTSTTAYLAMSAIALFIILQAIIRRGVSYRAARIMIVAVPALVASLVVVYLPDASNAVGSVIEEALLEKRESISFAERVGADLYSPAVLVPTWGFGVGWGNSRPSSMFFYVLSNAGLWGTLLLAWFGWRVYARVSRVVKLSTKTSAINLERRSLIQAFAVSVLAMLVAGTISVPELTHISFWANLSVLLALVFDAEKTIREHSFARADVDTQSSLVAVQAGNQAALGERLSTSASANPEPEHPAGF